MKNIIAIISVFTLSISSMAQIGIGTISPEGALDVNSNEAKTLGMVIPRVPDYSAVTSVSGTTPINGTLVYDTTLNQLMMYIDDAWITIGRNAAGDAAEVGVIVPPPTFENSQPPTYFKASNTEIEDRFGWSLALSADGTTLAVTAIFEDSNATGIDGDQTDNSASSSGAVYVYSRTGDVWTQEAYIKASNTDIADNFGESLSLSANGNILAIGAKDENSNATGINGDQTDNSLDNSGAVYIFERSGSIWIQQAYIKASNTGFGHQFGTSLSLSADGNTLAIGATGESSDATGTNGDQTNSNSLGSGAVYIFEKNGSSWTQETYIKASNTESNDLFGEAVTLSADGSTLAVGAIFERSNATGINGDQANNSLLFAGAVYVFVRNGISWIQQAYIKASNTDAQDRFGENLSLSADGSTLAIGVGNEDSNAIGINGDQTNNSANNSGAVYLFQRNGSTWSQQSYIKASYGSGGFFGGGVSLSADGHILAVGARFGLGSGTVSIFTRSNNSWSQQGDPLITAFGDYFGYNVSLSADGVYLGIGSIFEDSNATGINGDQTNDLTFRAGAAYVYKAE